MRSITISTPEVLKQAVITLPLSKSVANRMLVMAFLNRKESLIPIPDSDDSYIMLKLLHQLRNRDNRAEFDVCHAGTVFRFLCALMAITPGKHVLTGSSRMQQRPCGPLVDALQQIGAGIKYLKTEGFPPLEIEGKNLQGGEVCIDASVSSQFISALMMIAPMLQKGLKINISGTPVSVPYIRLTSELMKKNGAVVEWGNGTITIPKGEYKVDTRIMEADWSAASYWYALVALMPDSSITLNGLNGRSAQGDQRVSEIFKLMGVDSVWEGDKLLLHHSGNVTDHLIIELNDCPDLAPAIAVTCAGLQLNADLQGLETLTIKESNRLIALESELANLGYQCKSINNHSLQIHSGKLIPTSNKVKTYGDHRIAMAFTSLSVVAGLLVIEDPDVVNKSYPQFWNDLISAGFLISE